MNQLHVRLARVEEAVRRNGRAQCSVCLGHPTAVVYERWTADTKGPGLISTGERRLCRDCRDRITDDYRCPYCGTEALLIVVTYMSRSSHKC
jgi:hypothetical protein